MAIWSCVITRTTSSICSGETFNLPVRACMTHLRHETTCRRPLNHGERFGATELERGARERRSRASRSAAARERNRDARLTPIAPRTAGVVGVVQRLVARGASANARTPSVRPVLLAGSTDAAG